MATVAEIKNKRGRPDIYQKYYGDNANQMKAIYDLTLSNHVESKRGIADNVYITKACNLLIEFDREFFKHSYATPKGNFRYQSILIQIGRMFLQDGFTEETCVQTSRTALQLIQEGHSVHNVAQRIRNYRIMCKAGIIQIFELS